MFTHVLEWQIDAASASEWTRVIAFFLTTHLAHLKEKALAGELDDLNAAFGVLWNMYSVLVAFSRQLHIF